MGPGPDAVEMLNPWPMLPAALRPWLLSAAVLVSACTGESTPNGASPSAMGSLEGEVATPPFDVREGATDLVFTYVDDDGPHTVMTVAEVPADAREHVRVDSLTVAPERRLDPTRVYVADLRAPGEDAAFEVRVVTRAAFDAFVESRGGEGGEATLGGGEVVLYGAAWCGACREARGYLRARGVAFVDRDIEREPGARAEMMEKARAAGVRASGIPVIDFRGTILAGFSREAIDRLIAAGDR
jgi:glutaredoxin